MLKHGIELTTFRLCRKPYKPNSSHLNIVLNPFKFLNLNRALHFPHSSRGFRITSRALGKRKTSSLAQEAPLTTIPIPVPPLDNGMLVPSKRRASQRKVAKLEGKYLSTNPDTNPGILDGPEALRASPDADEADESVDVAKAGMDIAKQVKNEDEDLPSLMDRGDSDSSLSDVPDMESPTKKAEVPPAQKDQGNIKAAPAKLKQAATKEPQYLDPEAEGDEEADEEEIQAALSRPPPVNCNYLPLPWKGRLGYACLCTYLRFSNPPVFASRTCRIASIVENRHPLKDPSQPPHATKNRPDRDQPAAIARGQAYVESLGLANAQDCIKMIRWNDRYGIKFLRLSSEMFPFASHEEYGYKLASFASETLAAIGKVAAELGHRLTTHPGQFTQLGSPRKSVIENALRDLDYHAELLSLLKLPPQQNLDAVMILHLGGVFGDKAATLDRFRENYKNLPQGVKDRLVIENDDVSWSVHDLLPLCEELDIPMVLDYHHNNIIFDADQMREGTKDVMDLYPRILATWRRKNITPKMHYSEPTPAAITGRQRRKHNPRVATLPPCPPDMDLMIEAKDKEQAVFELMRTFKLPGYETFNDMLPHVRKDDNKPVVRPKKKTQKKNAKRVKKDDDGLDAAEDLIEAEDEGPVQEVIPDDDVGMGGPEGRVYWPPGMEDWLRPVKRVTKPKDPEAKDKMTPAKKRKAAEEDALSANKIEDKVQNDSLDGSKFAAPTPAKKMKPAPKAKALNPKGEKKKTAKAVLTPSASDEDKSEILPDSSRESSANSKVNKAVPTRKSGRAKKISYNEDEE